MMPLARSADMLDRIADGRTDLVFDYVAQGHHATSKDSNGVALIKWCAYYGDVSAIRFLVAQGESLSTLGENFDLGTAAFHGRWQRDRRNAAARGVVQGQPPGLRRSRQGAARPRREPERRDDAVGRDRRL